MKEFIAGRTTDDYFIESTTEVLLNVMGSLEVENKKLKEMAERIRIKEKYEVLAEGGSYVIN